MDGENGQSKSVKLYVGNLSWGTNEESLRNHFSQFGEVVEAVVITDKFTRRSKGFGFVTFASQEAANQAIEATNGKEFDGRELVVNVAMPPKPREDRGGYRDRGGDRDGGFRRERY